MMQLAVQHAEIFVTRHLRHQLIPGHFTFVKSDGGFAAPKNFERVADEECVVCVMRYQNDADVVPLCAIDASENDCRLLEAKR
jgi:hypothetical protein